MQVYPWALLVFWQLLMPAVSFWGHLGGLLAGELFTRGWLKALVPSEGSFQASPAAPCTDQPQARRAPCMHVMCMRSSGEDEAGRGAEVHLQRAEGSAVLAPARRWDCYIAHTGGTAFMTLPTSYSASSPADSSPGQRSTAQQVRCLSDTVRSAALQCSLTDSDARKSGEPETAQRLSCLRTCSLCNVHRGRHG